MTTCIRKIMSACMEPFALYAFSSLSVVVTTCIGENCSRASSFILFAFIAAFKDCYDNVQRRTDVHVHSILHSFSLLKLLNVDMVGKVDLELIRSEERTFILIASFTFHPCSPEKSTQRCAVEN